MSKDSYKRVKVSQEKYEALLKELEKRDAVIDVWKREAENQYKQVRFYRFNDKDYPAEGALDATIKEALSNLEQKHE